MINTNQMTQKCKKMDPGQLTVGLIVNLGQRWEVGIQQACFAFKTILLSPKIFYVICGR